jgi:hypothetical protein
MLRSWCHEAVPNVQLRRSSIHKIKNVSCCRESIALACINTNIENAKLTFIHLHKEAALAQAV